MSIYQIPVTYTCNGFVEEQGKDFNDAYDKVCDKIEKELLYLDDIVNITVEDLDVRMVWWVNAT